MSEAARCDQCGALVTRRGFALDLERGFLPGSPVDTVIRYEEILRRIASADVPEANEVAKALVNEAKRGLADR